MHPRDALNRTSSAPCRIILRSNSTGVFYFIHGPRNCRASISRKSILLTCQVYCYSSISLKGTAQRRRDKAIDCNTIGEGVYKKQRQGTGGRVSVFLSSISLLQEEIPQKKSSAVITGRRTRGIGITLQRNDIYPFLPFPRLQPCLVSIP